MKNGRFSASVTVSLFRNEIRWPLSCPLELWNHAYKPDHVPNSAVNLFLEGGNEPPRLSWRPDSVSQAEMA